MYNLHILWKGVVVDMFRTDIAIILSYFGVCWATVQIWGGAGISIGIVEERVTIGETTVTSAMSQAHKMDHVQGTALLIAAQVSQQQSYTVHQITELFNKLSSYLLLSKVQVNKSGACEFMSTVN